jgi:hypothetical protein
MGISVGLTGATIPPAGCTVTVQVTSNNPATFTNTIAAGGVTSANAGSNPAPIAAQLFVNGPPTVARRSRRRRSTPERRR